MTIETSDQVMPEADARRLTERIRSTLDTTARGLDRLASYVSEAYSQRADLALGYGSWREYADAEFGEQTRDLAAPIRRELVSYLSDEGMPSRAIGPASGVSDRRARQITSQVGSGFPPASAPSAESPDEPEIDLANVDMETGEIRDEPTGEQVMADGVKKARKVTGLDGKTYQRPEPREQKPKPEAVTSQFSAAIADLNRILGRFHRIASSPNYPQNKSQVATLHGSDLTRAISELQALADALH